MPEADSDTRSTNCTGLWAEAEGLRSENTVPVRARDDKLDKVVWIPFEDRLPGRLIVSAQCKTGAS